MNYIRVTLVFLLFFTIYTILFYVLTPVVYVLVDFFANNVDTSGWSSQAIQTWNMILTLFRYSVVWSTTLSALSTLIWYYLYPYREEVMTDVYR